LGDPYVDGRIILNGSSGSGMWGYGLDRVGSGLGQVSGTCECGNEPLGSIKCWEFLDLLQTVSFSRRTLPLGVSKYLVLMATSCSAGQRVLL